MSDAPGERRVDRVADPGASYSTWLCDLTGFKAWLRRQKYRDDEVGYFARFAWRLSFPRWASEGMICDLIGAAIPTGRTCATYDWQRLCNAFGWARREWTCTKCAE